VVKVLAKMDKQRSHEFITDESDLAKRLCTQLLEPAADHFARERFALSDKSKITAQVTYDYDDDVEISIEFSALRLEDSEDLDEGEESLVCYDMTISTKRPYREGMYWPGLESNELAPGDEVFEARSGKDDTSGRIAIEHECVVSEVWQFIIDDEDFMPRKALRFEYFDRSGAIRAFVSADNPEISTWKKFGETEEEDELLHELNDSMANTYSEEDVRTLIGALRTLGFENGFTLHDQNRQ
jgi:hypothetical protein